MIPQADSLPERTYALVVGVESYDVSPGWRLPGAAHDAHGFARWLTGTGQVPPDNLRLFLSPLAGTELPCPDGLPEYRPATEANIKRALLNDLPSRDGDLLWIYWAGHGFIDDSGSALLPYADAIGDNISNLNLGSALRRWRSSSVSNRRFGHQIALVDACQMDHRARGLQFEESKYGKGATLQERRQFVLYAARPGEVAQNNAERQSGLFTSTLLDKLKDLNVRESVEHLTEIAHEIQADFEEFRRNGQSRQTPTVAIHRGWDDSAIFTDAWTASEPGNGAPRLDQEAWDQLAALAQEHRLPPCAHDAYRWAFEVCACPAPPSGGLPEGGLTEIVRDLDERQGQPDRPLTLPFIRYLAAHAQDREWGARLDLWVETARRRLRATPMPPAPQRPAEPAALHVQLLAAPMDSTRYLVRVWRYQDRFTSAWESGTSLLLTDARGTVSERIAALVEQYAEEDPEGNEPGVERVEFHIPRRLIDEEFESWAVPTGPEGCREALGVLFEVVVRCPDERKGAARQKWVRKWRSYEHQGSAAGWEAPTRDAGQPIWLLGGDQVPSNLSGLLQAGDLPVCVLGDALEAVLKAGVPTAVWRRGGPPNGSTGDLATALAGDDGHIDLRNLPGTLRRLRIDADGAPQAEQSWSHPLALLWDDPNRRPELRPLKSTP